MHISIIKIVVHLAKQQDTVFVFTPIQFPNGIDYLSFQFQCTPGTGVDWVKSQIPEADVEICYEGFEVITPA